ncbi:ExeM/NucH family extracellular endonuclease [Gallaecimonas mangrovi]|uniref:ExeM/NucH family extracellular endonuclease n=1 Tax=Gallaecimonas mangrovi TaxID=2291597 RepID=UPI000E20C64A|nr:ExeM/NucH family extracellular endonuclease [Gallaecimonas mangrovi]
MLKQTALLATLALISQCASADVLFSEYVEGSSYNKALEITNTGSESASLEGMDVAVFFNGASTTSTRIALSGTLAAGASLVLAHTSADDSINADIRSGSVNFNGDDAVALEKDGEIVDVIGTIGVDPGSAFTSDDGSISTLNHTLRRDTSAGATTTFDFSQWQQFDQDTFDGLGCSGLDACDSSGEGDDGDDDSASLVCPTDGYQTIPSIQGDGASSPLVADGSYYSDAPVITEGRVTKVVSGLFKGFFLQDGAGDGNANTSDGIFVYTGSAPDSSIAVGDAVCVQGLVEEYYNFTEIVMDSFGKASDDLPAVQATPLNIDPEDVAGSMEKVEGMLVTLTDSSDMQVTRPFSYDYDSSRNNMMLAYGGPLYQPTELYPALTDEAEALTSSNTARTLYIDTDAKPANGVIPYFPGFDASQGYIRVADRVTNLTGVMAYSYSNYRLVVGDNQTLSASDFVHLDDRTAAPVLTAEGDLRVASFNIENFFNDAVGGDANPLGTNRGATTEADFVLQRSKIVNALLAIDADVLGLVEVENNGFGENSAIQSLLTALNDELPEDKQYAVVVPADGGTVGTDAVTSVILYRPAMVSPVGDLDILDMPNQITVDDDGTEDVHHGGRPSILQSFKRVVDGSVAGDAFRVAINHFRSKGSSCAEDEEGVDEGGQGSCNELRNTEASILAEHVLASATPTLILGDFNTYGSEDPILVMTQIPSLDRDIKTAHDTYFGDTREATLYESAGHTVTQGYGLVNLVDTHSYSYQYDGMVGRLDQAIATESLAGKVAAVADWHINSAESNLLTYEDDYSGSLVKSEGPFSSSDHDPVVVALKWPVTKAPAMCEHVITNSWQGGFQGAIRITNTSDSPISGWQVKWGYKDGSQVSGAWGGDVSGSGPYTATNLSWNSTIAPGDSVEVGFTASGDGRATVVSGDICAVPSDSGDSGDDDAQVPQAQCSYALTNSWDGGFQGAVSITNTSSSPIYGWQVGWSFTDGSTITGSWNATLSGSGPYSASHLDWNRKVEPGQTVQFGFVGQGTGQASAITGSVCQQ